MRTIVKKSVKQAQRAEREASKVKPKRRIGSTNKAEKVPSNEVEIVHGEQLQLEELEAEAATVMGELIELAAPLPPKHEVRQWALGSSILLAECGKLQPAEVVKYAGMFEDYLENGIPQPATNNRSRSRKPKVEVKTEIVKAELPKTETVKSPRKPRPSELKAKAEKEAARKAAAESAKPGANGGKSEAK